MNTIRLLSFALLASFPMLPASVEAAEAPAPIPFSEVGAKATADYKGDAIGITATPDGARLHTAFQKLSGTVTSDGLWLDSTSEKGGRLQVRASAVGRENVAQPSAFVPLPDSGTVAVREGAVVFTRPGLTEEYSVSVDGVRQDFIIAERPAGTGALSVELAVRGARAEAADSGAKLILDGSERVLAYSRLRVTDAHGRALSATLLVPAVDRLVVRVEDAQAAYPIRIDPTFSGYVARSVSPNPFVYTSDQPATLKVKFTGPAAADDPGVFAYIYDANNAAAGAVPMAYPSGLITFDSQSSLPPGTYGLSLSTTDSAPPRQITFTVVDPRPNVADYPQTVTGSASAQPFVITTNDGTFYPNVTVVVKDLTTGMLHPEFSLMRDSEKQITVTGTFAAENHDWSMEITNPATGNIPSSTQEIFFTVYGSSTTPPAISSITPTRVRASQGAQTVTIEGANFGQDAAITLTNTVTHEVFTPNQVGPASSRRRSFEFTFQPPGDPYGAPVAPVVWTIEVKSAAQLPGAAFLFKVGPPIVSPRALIPEPVAPNILIGGPFEPNCLIHLAYNGKPYRTVRPLKVTRNHIAFPGSVAGMAGYGFGVENPGAQTFAGFFIPPNGPARPGAPTITALSPAAGVTRSASPQRLQITGTNFSPETQVFLALYVNGVPTKLPGEADGQRGVELTVDPESRRTTSLSVSYAFNPPAFSSYVVTVQKFPLPSPGDPRPFVVNWFVEVDETRDPTLPKLASIAPTQPIKSETARVLTVTGVRFPEDAQVNVLLRGEVVGADLPIYSATTTQIVFSATLREASEDYTIEVNDPLTGHAGHLNFSTQLDPQAPVITSITPVAPDGDAENIPPATTVTLNGIRFPADPIVLVDDEAVEVDTASSTKIVFPVVLRSPDTTVTISVIDPVSGRSGTYDVYVYTAGEGRVTGVSPAYLEAAATPQSVTFTGAFLPLAATNFTMTNQEGDRIDDIHVVSSSRTKLVVRGVINYPGRYSAEVSNDDSDTLLFSFDVGGTAAELLRPSITSLSPSPVMESADAQSFTIRGQGFVPGATVTLRDETTGDTQSELEPVTITDSKITVSFAFGTEAHQWSAQIVNPDAESSDPVPFEVVAPPVPPTITGVNPFPVQGGSASQTFTITGTGFATGATVLLRDVVSGEDFVKTPASPNATVLTVSAQFGIVAHNWSVEVLNADGGLSTPFPFAVLAKPTPNPPPVITTVSGLTGANTKQTLTINGSGFVTGCDVTLRDLTSGQVFPAVAVQSFGAAVLTLSFNFTTAGHNWTVEVTNLTGEKSGQFAFAVEAPATVPTISGVDPSPVTGANTPQDFIITGTNFTATSSVNLRDLTTGQVLFNVPLISQEATELVVRPVFSTAAHHWSAEVVNGSGKRAASTGQFVFDVLTPAASQPDLVPSSVTVTPTTSEAGLPVVVSWTMTNHGQAQANASTVKIFLTTSNTEVLPEDLLLGTATTPALQPPTVLVPTAVMQTATVTLPPTALAGAYYLCVQAYNVPNEGNVADNAAFTATAVTLTAASQLAKPFLASITPSPIPGATTAKTVELSGTNLSSKTKISFTNITTRIVTTVKKVKVLANGHLTASMIFGGLASDWTVTATNLDGSVSGALAFNVLDKADGFSLLFPLPGLSAATAHFNSVFDHAMLTPFVAGTGATAGVVSYTDEHGDVQNTALGVIRKVKIVSLYAFKKTDNSAFSVGGLYDGPGTAASLSFDGSPGYDYFVNLGTNVLATAAGKVYGAGKDVNHTIYIDHGNGYRSYYLNCATIEVKNGSVVQPGDVIAKSGKAGVEAASLHFEVRKQLNGKWVPVDPYGWSSDDGNDDPYTVPNVSTVDGVNANLWAP